MNRWDMQCEKCGRVAEGVWMRHGWADHYICGSGEGRTEDGKQKYCTGWMRKMPELQDMDAYIDP